MNWDVVKGDWNQFQGKAHEEFGKLSHDELTQVQGNFEQFVGKLQEKYGWSREKAEQEAHNFADKHTQGQR